MKCFNMCIVISVLTKTMVTHREQLRAGTSQTRRSWLFRVLSSTGSDREHAQECLRATSVQHQLMSGCCEFVFFQKHLIHVDLLLRMTLRSLELLTSSCWRHAIVAVLKLLRRLTSIIKRATIIKLCFQLIKRSYCWYEWEGVQKCQV